MSVVGTVTIEVVEAKDLPAMDFNLSADPYVRIGMFSDAFYTHRKNKTRSPVWNQAFEVELTEEKLEYHVEFEVIDYDEHTNNDIIGDVRFNPCREFLTTNSDSWYPIENDGKQKGQLHLKITYRPAEQ